MRVGSPLILTDTDSYKTTKNTEIDGTKKNKDSSSQNRLSQDDLATIAKLQSRDTEVRAHEMAHQSAGGGLTGGANFSYQRGPDGKMYAVGGDVSISMPSGNDPKKLVEEARKVVAAAMAPSNPSAQDFAVATSARAIELKAQQEINIEISKELQGKKSYQNSENSPNENRDKSFDISV